MSHYYKISRPICLNRRKSWELFAAGGKLSKGTDISDQAVSDRLSGCAAWLSTLLQAMLPRLPNKLVAQRGGRWLLIDGSTVPVAGARGTNYRIHLGWDWVTQKIVAMRVTDVQTAESLQLYELQAGDVVRADRG